MRDLPLCVRELGRARYLDTWRAMQAFTDQRGVDTPDELWVLEHEPVFTLGMNADPAHLLAPGDIPVVQVDRGGQVTYHGPGQLVVYPLIDLRRAGLGVRDLVSLIEQALVDTLAHWNISASPRREAPGVYIDSGEKIASLGLRIRKGRSYHGLNFNVAMDMTPWSYINPCGLGVAMTQLQDLVEKPPGMAEVTEQLAQCLTTRLGYNKYCIGSGDTVITDLAEREDYEH